MRWYFWCLALSLLAAGACGSGGDGGAPDAATDPCAGNVCHHGTCTAHDDKAVCACAQGWSGAGCDRCAGGFHDDGNGGCTEDPCTPDPCLGVPHQVCAPDGGRYTCPCAPGYHRSGSACVPDETCAPDTCSGHGTCSATGGVVSCACDPGYTGAHCDRCDAAHGWHSDGHGACTQDPCVPDPCTAPHKGVCAPSSNQNGYTCTCDPGWHDDGVGTCTQNPCQPNPCAATNQACQDNGNGTYTCYTPPCDDGNPCTDDTLVQGVCSHHDKNDGAACSTTVCKTGQTCTAGQCGGGNDVTCNDANPCTRDSCDAVHGCAYTNDDSLVPDDAFACTVDTCHAGVASHTPSDARCGDGLACDGAETCQPTGAGHDTRGCVAGTPLAPPWIPWSPCRHYGACQEPGGTFPLITLPPGTSCDDGIACTTGDVCKSDYTCAGTATPGCPAGSCTTTTGWPAAIDVGVALLDGNIRLDSGAFPAVEQNGGGDLSLIDLTTGARQRIGGPQYSWDGSKYALVAGSDHIHTLVVPGVYDLAYRRGWSYSNYTNGGTWVYKTADGDAIANGDVILERNLVIGKGNVAHDVNVPTATMTGTITVGGLGLPAVEQSGGFTLYLVNVLTGSKQMIGGPQYSWDGSKYALVAGSDHINTRLVAGTYDLRFQRGWSYSNYDNGGTWVYKTADGDPLPNGDTLLRRNIVVSPGAQVLDVDVPVVTVTGQITLAGGPFPAVEQNGGATLYLVNVDTGSKQMIGGPQYSWDGSKYALIAGSDHIATFLPAGTYDLRYQRGWSYSNYPNGGTWAYQTAAGDTIPNGDLLLQRNIVLAPGARTLDVDVPTVHVTGQLRLNGGAFPAVEQNGGFSLYLVNRTTGTKQHVGGVQYGWDGSKYALVGGSDRLDTLLVAGSYDLLYQRGWSYSNYDNGGTWVYKTADGDTIPNGDEILATGIELAAGSYVLDVNVQTVALSGHLTLGGGAFPAVEQNGGFSVYLIDLTTGTRQYIGGPQYSWDGSRYSLVAGSDQINTLVLPGMYDVSYQRGWSYSNYANGGTWVYQTPAGDAIANGDAILRAALALAPGPQSLNLDVGNAAISTPITLASGSWPPVEQNGGASLYVTNATTPSKQYAGGPQYSWDGSRYSLVAGSDRLTTGVLPGVYSLRYQRGWSYSNYTNGGTWVYQTAAGDTIPNGDHVIGMCLRVP